MKMDSSPDFIDEPFMSGKEKEVVLNAWTRFLKNGCKFHDFTDALYRHLTLHCSFIAHYDRRGFYEFYFATPGTPRSGSSISSTRRNRASAQKLE
jgi:hypothetical protein